MGSSASDVPVQKIYIVSTDGTFMGFTGTPIIEYHTVDGNSYSDFMNVVFVQPDADVNVDDIRSVADITAAGMPTVETDIIMNIPVVPNGSFLQHPVKKGTEAAPINPTPVYYRGVEVWTYLFEVTDKSAADCFASTRTTDNPNYAIIVTPFASPSSGVLAAPLWHLNQFSNGVVEGENNGGPSPAGMRNVINLDRGDAG